MENLVAEFMANLFIAGLSKEDANARSYDYALALGIGQLPTGVTHVSAKMMLHATELIVKAQPIARRIYDAHYMAR